MVAAHRKYIREQKAKDDKQQALLSPTTKNGIRLRPQVTVDIVMVHTGEYLCPFCLHKDKIEKFLISTKKGYHKGLGKCPECGNQMKLKTLTEKMTPEQYADFVYPYRVDGFWQRCPYETWKQRMRQLGWAYRFWQRYKELSGEESNESYAAYLERKQKEEYESAEMHDE